jgi:hypothetical protein
MEKRCPPSPLSNASANETAQRTSQSVIYPVTALTRGVAEWFCSPMHPNLCPIHDR